GTSSACTRSRARTSTAPANGVGTEGTKTVSSPSSSSSMMKPGTRPSPVSPRELLGEAAKHRVAGNSLEQRLFNPLPRRLPHPRADRDSDEKAQDEHQEERQEVLRRYPLGEERGDRPHHADQRLHRFEEQQHGEVE